jgi:hypothetical protein
MSMMRWGMISDAPDGVPAWRHGVLGGVAAACGGRSGELVPAGGGAVAGVAMSTAAKPSLRQLTYRPSEKQLQAQIVGGLRAAGYIVLETGHYVKQTRCPRCGEWHTPHTGTANTPGTSDLLVSHPKWPVAIMVALELKTPEYRTLLGTIPAGRLSKEQKDLAQLGRIAVVRSIEDAMLVLDQVERRIA